MFCQMLFLTGEGDSNAIVKRLSKLSKNSTFTELYISAIHVDDVIVKAVQEMLHFKRFRVGVHIAHCTGKVNQLIDAIYANSKVQKLTMLTDCPRPDFSALGRGLTRNTHLRRLAIQAPLSPEAAKALGEGISTCRALQELSVSISGTNLAASKALAKGLKRNASLTTLKLIRSGKQFGSNADEDEELHLSVILKALKKHPTLKKLVLQNSACSTAGIPALAEILRSRHCRLTQLELVNYRYRTEVLPDLPVLMGALQANCSLRKLSLSGHYLCEQDVSSLSCSISTSGMLQELCLTNCGLNDTSACILAMWLYELSSLKRLYLKDNPFGSVGARELCEAVKIHWELEEVLLPGTTMSKKRMQKWQEMIEFYLILNAGGRRLLREHNFPTSLWAQVLARAEQTCWDGSSFMPLKHDNIQSAQSDIIYHLLQGPAALSR